MLLDPDGRTETILTLTLDGFLFFSPSLPRFDFFSPCCSLVRGCCSQMEIAEMIKLPTNYFRPAYFFFLSLIIFIYGTARPQKLFSDLSGTVSL